jgi:hypothetical protein
MVRIHSGVPIISRVCKMLSCKPFLFFPLGLTTLKAVMNRLIIFIFIFLLVSSIALIGMKYILWAMFRWGGFGAILLALFFFLIYVGIFFAVTRKWKYYEDYISINSLKLIWILGVVELGLLGILYHQVPQFFPSFIADLFFA